LRFEKSFVPGYVSNGILRDRIIFNGTWILSDVYELDGGITYEWAENTGGISVEEFERIIAQIRLKYIANARLDYFIEYVHVNKQSNLFGRTFDQNRISAGLNYKF